MKHPESHRLLLKLCILIICSAGILGLAAVTGPNQRTLPPRPSVTPLATPLPTATPTAVPTPPATAAAPAQPDSVVGARILLRVRPPLTDLWTE